MEVLGWIGVVAGICVWVWFMYVSLGCMPPQPQEPESRPMPWCFRGKINGDLVMPCFEDVATCVEYQTMALGQASKLPGTKVGVCFDVTDKLPGE